MINNRIRVLSSLIIKDGSNNIESKNELDYKVILIEKIKSEYYRLFINLSVGYGIMVCFSLIFILFFRRNRSIAFTGNIRAVHKVLLPTFEPFMWLILTLSSGYLIYFIILIIYYKNIYNLQLPNILETENFIFGGQYLLILPIIFMYQSCVSIAALRRTMIYTFLYTGFNLPIAWLFDTYKVNTLVYRIGSIVKHNISLLCFIYVFIKPPTRASIRSIRIYCTFSIIFIIMLIVENILFLKKDIKDGFQLVFVSILWASLLPYFIWSILRADTEYWRGMGQKAIYLQQLFRRKNQFNNKISERLSSEGLHVFIEMHRKLVIDFAVLKLHEQIGQGSTSFVFKGTLHSKVPVAVKVYTPTGFNDDTIAEFSHEAALCGALRHPNIVTFYGMCVCPPTICLVSELCIGTLEDIKLCQNKERKKRNLKQLNLDIAYMLDAARAVAYLHSFSPPLIHRDIKPANFLIDNRGFVKLTDFGESRSLPTVRNDILSINYPSKMIKEDYINMYKDENHSSNKIISSSPLVLSIFSQDEKYQKEEKNEVINMSLRKITEIMGNMYVVRKIHLLFRKIKSYIHLDNNRQTININLKKNKKKYMTVRGTADYMAPELINGKAGLAHYDQAADVYSLAITMWDILYPGIPKYSRSATHLKVYESVLLGQRPPMNLDNLNEKDNEMENICRREIKLLIQKAWHVDVSCRPTAGSMIQILEKIQRKINISLAQDLETKKFYTENINDNSHFLYNEKSLSLSHMDKRKLNKIKSYSGNDLVDSFLKQKYVYANHEAMRLGNSLMDSGYIHHIKHQYSFDNVNFLYYTISTQVACRSMNKIEKIDLLNISNKSTIRLSNGISGSFCDYDNDIYIKKKYNIYDKKKFSCRCSNLSQGFQRKVSRQSIIKKEGIKKKKKIKEIFKSTFLNIHSVNNDKKMDYLLNGLISDEIENQERPMSPSIA